ASFLIPIRSHNICDDSFLASRLACMRCTPNSLNKYRTKLLTASVAYPLPETSPEKQNPISTVSLMPVYQTDKSPITFLWLATAKLNIDSLERERLPSFLLNSSFMFSC